MLIQHKSVEFIWIFLYTWDTMNEYEVKGKRKRRGHRMIRLSLQVAVAGALFFRDKIQADFTTIVAQSRLFIGIALLSIGVLLFQSDKYCDGNPSTYAACTRPSTYYYYPWWAIVLVILGSFSIVLWFLRKHN